MLETTLVYSFIPTVIAKLPVMLIQTVLVLFFLSVIQTGAKLTQAQEQLVMAELPTDVT